MTLATFTGIENAHIFLTISPRALLQVFHYLAGKVQNEKNSQEQTNKNEKNFRYKLRIVNVEIFFCLENVSRALNNR